MFSSKLSEVCTDVFQWTLVRDICQACHGEQEVYSASQITTSTVYVGLKHNLLLIMFCGWLVLFT